MTGEDLAEMLRVPETTVYSDIRTLRRCGIPVRGEHGPGGGFWLRPDHTRSDFQLAPRDAMLMILGAGMLLGRTPVPAGSAAIRSAFLNTYKSLPAPLQEFCAAIGKMTYAPPDTPDLSLYSDAPEMLTHAIPARIPLDLDLADGATVSVVPEAVQWNANGWKLIAHKIPSGKRAEIDLANIRAARFSGKG